MLLQTKLYTVEEFEDFLALPENVGRNFELVHGEIVEKTLNTELHGLIVGNAVFFLQSYVKIQKQGRLGISVQNRMPKDPYNSRQPDISYFIDTSRPVVTKGGRSADARRRH